MQSRVLKTIFATFLVALLSIGWLWFETQRTHTVIVTGQHTLVLPTQVTLIAGLRDTLIIRNDTDESVLLVGRPIAPHQQIRQRYRTPGTYQYVCTSHGGASMDVIVEPFNLIRWLQS
jgi:plastocyanin